MENHVSEKILDQLCHYIEQKLPPDTAEKLKQFARQYYQNVPFNDLENIAIEDLYGAMLSHWNLALQRQPDEQKIHIYNPTLENHGWQSQHTIIEIVTRDMPFLLQSISMEINRQGLTNHLVIHPVFNFIRNEQGELLQLAEDDSKQSSRECLLHLEIDRQTDSNRHAYLKQRLSAILRDVAAATDDWPLCLKQLGTIIQTLSEQETDEEEIAFLKWLQDDHFVFLGYREYQLQPDQQNKRFVPIADTGLGILRDSIADPASQSHYVISAEAFKKINEPGVLLITKATSRSTVHRSVFMDYIGVKQFDAHGKLVGEKRFIGLYNSSAYLTELKNIPLVRKKIQQVIDRFAFRKASHESRVLLFVLQTLPRDEVFQADAESLYHYVHGVLQLQERQHVKVFVRQDLYGHFVSLLVFVPRERYHTTSRKKIQAILEETFQAKHIDFSVQLSESILARIHFIIHTDIGQEIDYDIKEIEQKIIDALAEWTDSLKQELNNYYGEAKGNDLFDAYKEAFSAAYRDEVSVRTAILDIEKLENMLSNDLDAKSLLFSPLTASSHKPLRFKLFSRTQVSLSRSLPMLENMGVKVCDERPYEIRKKNQPGSLWIHDFGLLVDKDLSDVNLENLKARFQEAFEQCWIGRVENDGFNQLVLKARISWQQVNIFRCFYLYLRQIGITFSQAYIEKTLADNPEVVRLLIQFFNQRFDPSLKELENSDQALSETISAAIDKVQSLDEDRILRRFMNLMQAAVRTNYFRYPLDSKGIPYFSIKFNSSRVQDIPKPVPYVEVFVYSPRVEGIHLRGGLVARGGLRWSDRREDFRTEVLGLMKAQMTKNAVIVPTGAKGGFFVKNLKSIDDKEQRQQEVVQCYQVFIRGLLDLTDNLKDGKVIKPEKVNCYDGDDSYLVVAADKGTARFSDYANALAEEYGFWLGDAFASGGSVGYDHKAMGITARGAWESVKHHFLHLGIDYVHKPFTVVGIGGMAGDVFGNGMLLSDKIKLVAVFDHQHIFLDPDPDPALSFQERKRLFELPAAQWSDYDKTLISKGGGVYQRSSKSIQISPRMMERLNIRQPELTPNELIKCILRAPVDLLWNGGIGTYVKARQETNLSVGDRSNDALRVNGSELRCLVVAEGGNLGFTQAGRIEYARQGGKINTDSIDNSAGVDCSDHEVNIKILLNTLVMQGDLTDKQRREILLSMTDDVASLVLKNNILQNQAICTIEQTAKGDMPGVQWVIDILEQKAHLDRKLEVIPDSDELLQRINKDQGLYRPEISVLLAYCKQMLKQQLAKELASIDEPLLQQELQHYFPGKLQQHYQDAIQNHYLAKDIVVNCLINGFVNRMGIVFPYRILEQGGVSTVNTVNVYKRVCYIFSVDSLWREIEMLQTRITGELSESMFAYIRRLIERSMNWFMTVETELPAMETLESYFQGIQQLKDALPTLQNNQLNKKIDQQVEHLIEQGVPAALALDVVSTEVMYLCLDVVWLQKQTAKTLTECAQVFFILIESLDLLWLRDKIYQLPQKNLWQALAKRTARQEFSSISCSLALSVLQQPGASVKDRMENWRQCFKQVIDRYQQLLAQVKSEEGIELEKITVLLKELQDIAGYGQKRQEVDPGQY